MFAAPELRKIWVVGVVVGKPGMQDGTRICCTHIVDANGRVIKTRSGSSYRLGRIGDGYRKWLTDHGLAYDPRNPIKIHAQKSAAPTEQP